MITLPKLFKKPKLAVAVCMVTAFAMVTQYFLPEVDPKSAWILCSLLGVGFIGLGSKAINNAYSNLSVLFIACGLSILGYTTVDTVLTNFSVYSSNGLEPFQGVVGGAILAFFSGIENG